MRVADDRRCLLGESPRWDEHASRLVWVDILAGRVLASSLESGSEEPVSEWWLGGNVAAVLLRSGGRGFVVARDRSVFLLDEEMRVERTLVENVPGEGRGLRINECAVDPAGRLLVGTMTTDWSKGAASLWRLEETGELEPVIEEVTVSNGMDWSPDGATLYYVDSATHSVVAMDYGEVLGPPRHLADVGEGDAVPDGLYVDGDGALWVAVAHGGEVQRIAPDGSSTERFPAPARFVTSCVMAGGERPVLYVTSAFQGVAEDEMPDQPQAGLTFAEEVEATPASPRYFPG